MTDTTMANNIAGLFGLKIAPVGNGYEVSGPGGVMVTLNISELREAAKALAQLTPEQSSTMRSAARFGDAIDKFLEPAAKFGEGILRFAKIVGKPMAAAVLAERLKSSIKAQVPA